MPEMKHLADTSVDHLRLVLDAGKIGVWELDLVTGQAWRSPRHDAIFGYPEMLPAWTYEQFLEHVVAADRDRVDALQQTAVGEGREWRFDCRIERADGQERWISAAGVPLRNDAGEVTKLIGHVVDITETKQREDRLQLLTRELNHRVRNMLAMMRAMIALTARGADDVDAFAKVLEGRIAALSRTLEMFASEDVQVVSPGEIVARELAAFPEYADRMDCNIEGERGLIASESQGFALLAHELMTNAIKYGAFSSETGRVSLTIREREDSGIQVVWREYGGPPVTPPERSGFGTRMMRLALGAAGKVDLDYAPDGLVCTIAIDPRAVD